MVSMDEPELFCPPTSKNGLGIGEPEEHLTTYTAPSPLEPDLSVRTEDQFGPRTLRVIGARELYVPTQKLVGDLGFPRRLNHHWCYEAFGPKVGQTVTVDDQLGADTVRVERPHRLCNPVEKVSEAKWLRIEERQVHLTCPVASSARVAADALANAASAADPCSYDPADRSEAARRSTSGRTIPCRPAHPSGSAGRRFCSAMQGAARIRRTEAAAGRPLQERSGGRCGRPLPCGGESQPVSSDAP